MRSYTLTGSVKLLSRLSGLALEPECLFDDPFPWRSEIREVMSLGLRLLPCNAEVSCGACSRRGRVPAARSNLLTDLT